MARRMITLIRMITVMTMITVIWMTKVISMVIPNIRWSRVRLMEPRMQSRISRCGAGCGFGCTQVLGCIASTNSRAMYSAKRLMSGNKLLEWVSTEHPWPSITSRTNLNPN